MGVVIGPPIRAAGGVLWRRLDDGRGEPGVEVAVIRRPRYQDWSLPKGKLASGESDLDGAVREVLEETGFHVRVGRPLGETRYEKSSASGRRQKIVRWWAMQAEEGAFSPTGEVDDLVWLSLADAAALLTRDTDRDVLERFARGQAPTRTVLIVRHASAGDGSAWSGDDRGRPLDRCGIAQADALLRLLSRFDIGRLVAADVLCCAQTIAPLAEALQVEITSEPLVSETGYVGREEEAIALLRGLGDPDHDAVVCSQGGVIPDLLRRLGDADGYALDEPLRAPEGSTWALSLDEGGCLIALDFLDAPNPPGCSDRGLA